MGIFNFAKQKSGFEIMLEEAKKTQKQNGSDALYIFEHQNFRKLFFDTNEKFVDSLINRKDFAYFVYSKQCELMRQAPKYTEDQFTLKAYLSEKKQIVFILTPPEPYRVPLCHQIYMIVDEHGKAVNYYTLEKDFGALPPVVCGWDQNGTHYHYDANDINDLDVFSLVKELDLNKVNSYAELLEQAFYTDAKNSNNVLDDKNAENSNERTKDFIITGNVNNNGLDSKILFCRKCGIRLSNDENFCHNCGEKLINL